MDALEILKQMHTEAKSAFQQIEHAGPDQRGSLWSKLRPELVAHEQIEERFVYDPVAKEAGNRDSMLADWEQRHHQEVGEAEAMIREIGGLEPRDGQWLERVGRLRMTLEGHIQTEETEIWPKIREVWRSDRLERAGAEVQAAKSGGGSHEAAA